MNLDHRKFWLSRIIKNLGNKETIIVIKKCVDTIYKRIKMNKTTYYECYKYFWEYNLYFCVSKHKAVLDRMCAYQ
jgi:hypothetical protein